MEVIMKMKKLRERKQGGGGCHGGFVQEMEVIVKREKKVDGRGDGQVRVGVNGKVKLL